MDYALVLPPQVQREMDRLPAKLSVRILDAIQELRKNPRPHGCTKLKDEDDLWRIRVGKYRVVYTIDDDEVVILILRVAHRKDVYRDH